MFTNKEVHKLQENIFIFVWFTLKSTMFQKWNNVRNQKTIHLSEGRGKSSQVSHNARGDENISSQVDVFLTEISSSLTPSEKEWRQFIVCQIFTQLQILFYPRLGLFQTLLKTQEISLLIEKVSQIWGN